MICLHSAKILHERCSRRSRQISSMPLLPPASGHYFPEQLIGSSTLSKKDTIHWTSIMSGNEPKRKNVKIRFKNIDIMTYAEVDQCWCCKTLRHCSAAKWKQTVKTIHHLDHLHMYRFEYFCPYSSICVFVYLCICVFDYLIDQLHTAPIVGPNNVPLKFSVLPQNWLK